MTEEAATINTESEMTTPGNTEKENKMKMGDRQINPEMRLLLRVQKFAGDRAPGWAPHGRSGGDGPWAEQKGKGQKNTREAHKSLIVLHLSKNEAKRT
jgi:hypothetical protein